MSTKTRTRLIVAAGMAWTAFVMWLAVQVTDPGHIVQLTP